MLLESGFQVSVMPAARSDQLDRFIDAAIEQLDVSPADTRRVLRHHQSLGKFLSGYWAVHAAPSCIYLQGAIRLGTMTRALHRNDEYDVDAVFRLDLARPSISQNELRLEIGNVLEEFVWSKPGGRPWRDEGRRCWTLRYPKRHWAPRYPNQRFHLNILPALRAKAGNELLVADKKLMKWQPSNPIDYANWFYDRVSAGSDDRRAVELLVEDVAAFGAPTQATRTTLQRTVQALKRHRDKYFANDLQNRPASIVVTTLAAMAYSGDGTLLDVLRDTVAKMPDLVGREPDGFVVGNPVQPEENFTDQWAEYPHRPQRFFAWMEQVKADLSQLEHNRGMDDVYRVVVKALGERPALHAARKIAFKRKAPKPGVPRNRARITDLPKPVQPEEVQR
jgi:hypothetical protein